MAKKKPARKSRPRAKASAPKSSTAIKSKPTPEGRLWFDEHGHLNQSGPVPLSRYLGALSDQLRRFLARLDSCERNDAGDYLLRHTRAGDMSSEIRVLWDNVVHLIHASIAQTLPIMTPDQQADFKRHGVVVTTTEPTRNAQPLVSTLRQLLFSILYNADGTWVSEIPSSTVAQIRTIGDELTLDRMAWERSEGGRTRNSTVSLPMQERIDRLERAAAAVDTHAIDRAAQHAAEKTARLFGGGDDRGHAKRPALPVGIALTADHESILAVLGKTPTKCMVVIGVASAGTIRDRETVGRLLRELSGFGLVNRPHGNRKGYALTAAGRNLMLGAKPT